MTNLETIGSSLYVTYRMVNPETPVFLAWVQAQL